MSVWKALGSAIGLIFIVTFIVTWPTMLMFGVVHGFLPVIPAFGFWETMGVLVLIRLLYPGQYKDS